MTEQARWLPDPYGRYQQRYFDGTNWTAHVFHNGEQLVDPLGATLSIPFATPASGPTAGPPATAAAPSSTGTAATPAPPSNSPSSSMPWVPTPGRDHRCACRSPSPGSEAPRPRPESPRPSSATTTRGRRLAIAAVLIVAIAYAVRLGVQSQPEIRSAAVGAVVIGIPGLALAATGSETGGGTLVLAAVLLLAAWALPGMRGRPLMLGAGAVALVAALTAVGGDTAGSGELFDFAAADFIGGMAWLFIAAAVVLLAMVWWLDAHGYRGVGTSLVVAALLASALAVVKVVEDLGSTGAALLLALAGLAVAAVGDHGDRRASTWFGVAVAAIGTVAVFASALEPTRTADRAATFILAGLVLIVGPAVFKAVRASRQRQQPTPLQPPSSGGSGAPP